MNAHIWCEKYHIAALSQVQGARDQHLPKPQRHQHLPKPQCQRQPLHDPQPCASACANPRSNGATVLHASAGWMSATAWLRLLPVLVSSRWCCVGSDISERVVVSFSSKLRAPVYTKNVPKQF